MKTKPIVSIVMLQHNITPWLLECSKWCFRSIKEHTVYPAYEIIVVDNASTTFGWKELNREFVKQGAIVIRHEKNLGMTGGFNSGLDLASGEFIFMIENDVVATNFWVTNGLKCFSENPRCAIVKAGEDNKLRTEGKQENTYNQEKRYNVIQNSNPKWLKLYLKQPVKDLDNVEAFGIDAWTSLWCFGFRKEALKDIGGYLFDEKIGLNWDEDMDLIWRLRDVNWKTMVFDSMYVFHRAAQTCSLKGEYAASKEKEEGRKHFRKKHDIIISEHGWPTRRKLRQAGETLGHTYHEYGERENEK